MIKPPTNFRDFHSLIEIVHALRGPNGCPWDKEQTPHSLTQFAIEEAFELAEAIEQGSSEDVVEELGDLLLQVILHAEIASQEKRFNVDDVIETICKKMVSRHPHVFGDVTVADSAEVLRNWQALKDQEKKNKTNAISSGPFNVPINLPALQRAQKIGAKTAKDNFDWEHSDHVLAKIMEELEELKIAIAQKDKTAISSEIGDVLFSVAQYARHLGVEPEQSLRETNSRFERRFSKMRELAQSAGHELKDLSKDELEALWSNAKKLV